MLAPFLEAYSQNNKDSIEVIPDFFGTQFKQNGKVLKPRQLKEITLANPEAYAEMQKAKNNSDAAGVMGFIAGALIGWPLGTYIAGGDPQWGMAVAGGGLILLSIPLSSAYAKHASNGARIYNSGLKTTGFKKEFYFEMNPGRVGFAMRF